MDIFQFLDYAGVAVFSATGALAAARKKLDIISFLFFANVTGMGGGTFRDLLLNVNPVFWVKEDGYLVVCSGTAIFMYFAARFVEHRYQLLLWLDAIGLAAYAVLGAHIGLTVSASPFVAIVTGVLTASFGGILRDVVSNEPSVLLRKEVYVTAALTGACIYVILAVAGINPLIATGLSVAVAFIIRGGAISYGWQLPGYNRPSS